MNLEDIIYEALKKGDLSIDDVFSGAVFYFMGGIDPNERIIDVVNAVASVRDTVIYKSERGCDQ